jgi:hypothetical protein
MVAMLGYMEVRMTLLFLLIASLNRENLFGLGWHLLAVYLEVISSIIIRMLLYLTLMQVLLF